MSIFKRSNPYKTKAGHIWRKALEETNRCSESTKNFLYCLSDCRNIIKRFTKIITTVRSLSLPWKRRREDLIPNTPLWTLKELPTSMKHLTFISDRKLKRWINTLWLKFSCIYTQTNSILPKEEKKSIYPFGQELTILNSLMISTGWFTDFWTHFSVSQKWIYQTYLLLSVYLQNELFHFWSTGKNKTRKYVEWTVGVKSFYVLCIWCEKNEKAWEPLQAIPKTKFHLQLWRWCQHSSTQLQDKVQPRRGETGRWKRNKPQKKWWH